MISFPDATKQCEIKKGLGESMHSDEKPYAWFNTQSGLFGPSGLWSLVADTTVGFEIFSFDIFNPQLNRIRLI